MTPPIAFQDLSGLHESIAAELDAAMTRVLRSGRYILGEEVEQFEEEYSAYCGSRHCVGVASGLDALKLSFMALGIGPGDEVIVPSHGYHATWLAVTSVGATPVPVEPAPGSFIIDPDGIRAAIGSRTRAIAPVHLYGEPADMTAICAIAGSAGLAVVEDAAQAHGAEWQGRKIGAHGTMTCWSFYPTKNLGGIGDGGGVTTNDDRLAGRLRHLRNYGMDANRSLADAGLNSRLDELQAAVLSVKLRHLDAWNARRSASAARYRELLDGSSIVLPRLQADATQVWHQFVIRVTDRMALQSRLASEGIQTMIHYPEPVHRQRAFAHLGHSDAELPLAATLADQILSLPIAPYLRPDQQDRIADVLLGRSCNPLLSAS
jgi:dTDP-4-amino-4,6-dideoxygalactose transaminase